MIAIELPSRLFPAIDEITPKLMTPDAKTESIEQNGIECVRCIVGIVSGVDIVVCERPSSDRSLSDVHANDAIMAVEREMFSGPSICLKAIRYQALLHLPS